MGNPTTAPHRLHLHDAVVVHEAVGCQAKQVGDDHPVDPVPFHEVVLDEGSGQTPTTRRLVRQVFADLMGPSSGALERRRLIADEDIAFPVLEFREVIPSAGVALDHDRRPRRVLPLLPALGSLLGPADAEDDIDASGEPVELGEPLGY